MSRKLTVFVTVLTMLMLLLKPGEMLAEASGAIMLWFNVVLPALLPFMAGMGILMRFGAADRLGRLFDPMMEPLFNVPGCAAFALAGGLLSGYPMGAKIVGELMLDKRLTPEEGQRVMSFCNNPGPFFLLGAVAAGMLGAPGAGYLLIAAVFSAAFTTGVLFRFYGGKTHRRSRTYNISSSDETRAFPMLKEVIQSCADSLVRIGGFMVLFSVIARGIELTGIFDAIIPEAWNPEVFSGLFKGILEMAGGAEKISGAGINFGLKLGLIAAISAFGGLSVHGQSLSMPGMEKIHAGVYMLSKSVNAALSFFYACLFWYLMPMDAFVFAARAGNADSSASLKSAVAFLGFTLLYVLFTQRKRVNGGWMFGRRM